MRETRERNGYVMYILGVNSEIVAYGRRDMNRREEYEVMKKILNLDLGYMFYPEMLLNEKYGTSYKQTKLQH